MNTPSEAMADSPVDAPAITPAALSATRPLYWSVRRELWENRSIYIAPLAVAALVVFGFAVSLFNLPNTLRDMSGLDAARQGAWLAMPYDFAAMAVTVTALIVGVFYCLGSLHNERRDRSILFWKSLPVSDLTTVLSKASIPLVVLPLVTFASIIAMQLIMLLLSTVVLVLNGLTAANLWLQIPWPQMSLVLLYGLAVLALWYAPIWGWLMLVSGWARRGTFLWAVLPPLAVSLVEKIAFHTSYFSSMLGYRFTGAFTEAFSGGTHHNFVNTDAPHVDAALLDPVRFLSSPGLWVGLGFAGVFLAAAIWQRRRREPL
jgi:ABC-2 type transport system permease protein